MIWNLEKWIDKSENNLHDMIYCSVMWKYDEDEVWIYLKYSNYTMPIFIYLNSHLIIWNTINIFYL